MLLPRQGLPYLDVSNPEILSYQSTWIRELPLLLVLLDDKHPLCSKIVLHLLLRLGQCAPLSSSSSQEYDNTQYSLQAFYSTWLDERSISYGPFTRLPEDSQELSVCCLYYFSFLDPLLLKSLALCCLCHDLKPFILFRIIEVLHVAYKAGRIQIADHISFFITVLSCFKVFPEKICPVMESDEISNRGTFKTVTTAVCSCLLQMGDDYLVFQILEKVVLKQISLELPLDNSRALLRMLIALDSRPTRLSEQSIITLSNFLPRYLIGVVSCIPEDDNESTSFLQRSSSHYYLHPCFVLFYRSEKLLPLVLNMMGSLVAETSSSLFSCSNVQYTTNHSSMISAIVSSVVWMRKDVKIQSILLSCKEEIDFMLQKIFAIQSSEKIDMTIEERHKMQCASDRLRTVTSNLFSGKPLCQ